VKKLRLPPLILSAILLATFVHAGNEPDVFWVARVTGYYGEGTNVVMTDAQRGRAVADAFEANNVASAAFGSFVESWRKAQQKPADAQKKTAAKKTPVDPGMLNIVLEKPGQKSVQATGPFATRKEAEAEIAARAAKDAEEHGHRPEAGNQHAAQPADSAKAGNEGRMFLRSQQLAMFLSIAAQMQQAEHNQKGLKSTTGHGANNKLLTSNPPP
jgi:hypothetical protein